MVFERGAEWRRWDLHIHTPGTQRNDQFNGSNLTEKWDNFYNDIAKYIGDGADIQKNVVAVGITDYLSIDNYNKVVSDKRMPDTVKLIVPNVEMRMVPMAKRAPVNVHCIFNPLIADELENRFFGKLSFEYNDRSYSATHSELIGLGRAITGDERLAEVEAYKKGSEQFVVDIKTLTDVFKNDKDLRENTIIAVSNNSEDGASGVTSHSDLLLTDGTSQTEANRRRIYQLSDMIFSAQKSDRDYFLGKKADDVDTVIEKCGSLKPCIHGSDAHKNSDIFEPKGERYCWIKADPTFNGLKQIIYEPETRVCIDSLYPEKKPDYQVIDRVEINDKDFSSTPIFFNDKLTCIIGGKSTGKSLLLNNMANTIDPVQLEEKNEVNEISFKKIDNFKVYWKDGKVIENGISDIEHKIVYIPQTYLNRLSDENEQNTEIDRIIEQIILQNSILHNAYNDQNEKLKTAKKELDGKIYNAVSLFNNWKEAKEDLFEIGTEEGIRKEINNLTKEKEKILSETEISQTDIEDYEKAKSREAEINNELIKNNEQIEIIRKIDSLIEVVELPDDIQSDILNEVSKSIEKIKSEAEKIWNDDKKTIIDRLQNKNNTLEKEKNEKMEIIKNLSSIVSKHEALEKLTQMLNDEKQKMNLYLEKKEKMNKKYSLFKNEVKEVACFCEKFRDIHSKYEQIVNENNENQDDDLDFSVKVIFKRNMFGDKIKEIYDRRVLKKHKDLIDPDDILVDKLNKEILEEWILKTFDGSIKLSGGKNVENALREIMQDWYLIAYNVVMDNDPIESMSPGKKALVLLKMLINLAESKCPILIDQPEDDLDNRSVFDELIPFVKKKKVDRQIIIVTHNANVVLGADAEEVIVANQRGTNSPNRTYRFEYRSGSIEEDKPIEDGENYTLEKQGIQQHICDILEGGKTAFDLRMHKYHI